MKGRDFLTLKNINAEELTEILDLNKIINVSDFANTKGIIERNFSLYI